jgi:hypothetical protein
MLKGATALIILTSVCFNYATDCKLTVIVLAKEPASVLQHGNSVFTVFTVLDETKRSIIKGSEFNLKRVTFHQNTLSWCLKSAIFTRFSVESCRKNDAKKPLLVMNVLVLTGCISDVLGTYCC